MPNITTDRTPQPGGAGSPSRAVRPQLTRLEDRATPAAITLTGTTAGVDLNQTDEEVTFTTTTAGVLTVKSTAVVTVNGVTASGPATLPGVSVVLVNDSAAGTAVTFDDSTVPYATTFAVALDNATSPVTFLGDSAFGGNHLTVTTAVGANGPSSSCHGPIAVPPPPPPDGT